MTKLLSLFLCLSLTYIHSDITSLSPLDGRYEGKVEKLKGYFSEYALIKYRLHVEVEYIIALWELGLPQLAGFDQPEKLREIVENFTVEDAHQVKSIEAITNHDVKAIEYFLKGKFEELGLGKYAEFIHFGLTSQDITNTAFPLMFKEAMESVYYVELEKVLATLMHLSAEWKDIPMLARTHGQPASPTTLGKEIYVFLERLEKQKEQLENISYEAKFGGATGNFNAHVVSYPEIDWVFFANHFVSNLGLVRQQTTTQIEQYDNLAAQFDALKRINTILTDMCRDIWQYVSLEYFKQVIKPGEVGSSTMPHKVNPIDFENAEGNLGVANAILEHLSAKLPISRLQRDLTDSTVLRNVGVPLGHTLVALKSIQKGLAKLLVNEAAIHGDLDNNWMVVAEAIQTILRREGYEKPYEALKELTRSNETIDQETLHAFIDTLNVDETIKEELKEVTPFNYTGIYATYE